MTRTTASARRAIKPHTSSLQYTNSTATILGTGNTLDTALPWAVSFDINFDRSGITSGTDGILTLKTDTGTPFSFIAIPSNARFIDFGANITFDRFFSSSSSIRDVMRRGWHQVLITFDGVDRLADTSYKLYVDGRNYALTNGSGLAGSTNQNAIGVAVSSTGTFDMADLTIWNGGSTMTAQQVSDWYYNYILPSGPTLIRRYQHTDGSGSTLTDSTGNQNGTIGTATWTADSLPTKTRTST